MAEKVGIDNLFSNSGAKTFRSMLGNMVKQGIAEGMEEGLTTVMNTVSEQLIMGGKSKYSKAVAEYSKTMSEEEAKKKAFQNTLEDIAFDMLGGMITGSGNTAVMTGARAVKNTAQGKGALSGLTVNEQKVVDKVYKDAVAEAEKDGKVSQKRKAEIYDQVIEQMDRGEISTETIEEVLGGLTAAPAADAVTDLLSSGEATSPANGAAQQQIVGQAQKNTASEETAVKVTSAGSAITDQNKAKNTLAYTLATNLDTVRDMEPVSQLTGRELSNKGMKLSDQIREFFKSIGNKVFRNGLGDVELGEYSVGGMLNHRPVNRAKVVSLAAVPDVISSGKQISYDPDWKGRGYESYTFAAPVTVNGTEVYVAAVVNKLPNNKFYLSEMVDSEGNYVRIEESPSGNSKNGLPMGPENQQGRDYAGPEGLPEGDNPSAAAAEPTSHFNNIISDSTENVNTSAVSVNAQTGRVLTKNEQAVVDTALVEAQGEDVPSVDTNAVSKPLTSYPAEKQRAIRSYLRAVDGRIKAFVESVKNGDLRFKRQKISDVSERAAEDIGDLLNIDVTGYTHNINTTGIQHILNRHGENGKQDTTMALEDDIARVGWVLDNYDSVELMAKNSNQVYSSEFKDRSNRPAPQIRFVKKIDGSYYVVEAAFENDYKKLWVQSAYLQKKEDVTQVPAEGQTANHETNARSALASPSSDDSIHENVPTVNGKNIGTTAGVNAQTGRVLTKNEQAVVDKVYKDRVAEAEKDGKVSQKRKAEIYDQVIEQMDRGEISTETIEEVLGGKTYKSYRETVDGEDALQKEYDGLKQMKASETTLEQQERFRELKQQLADSKKKSSRAQLKKQLGQEVSEMVKSDRLAESYNERGRRSQAFQADVSQYDEKQRATVQAAIHSGILNNTRRAHEFVDLVAKISADKGVAFNFADNKRLKETGFALEGVTVNGFVSDSGVTVNVNSAKALNSVVGHEIAHVLEGTELYDSLKTAIETYAKGKGDYDARLESLTKLYEGKEGYTGADAAAKIEREVVADLVGDYLFTDKDFVQGLSTEHRNVFQKIFDEVKYLCRVATAGSKEARQVCPGAGGGRLHQRSGCGVWREDHPVCIRV